MTSDGAMTWVYAGNNRPSSAGSTTFLLNALGQRVKKVGASTTLFAYDEAGHLWGEYDSTGALIKEHIWLNDLLVGATTGVLSYVHSDHLGTPRMITRASDNAIQWRWDNTESFGNSAPNDNPSGLGTFAYNLRFPGQYFDAETAKLYNYYRDYDPAVGRYVESDPIGLRGGINTYGYARARPLKLRDVLGLTPGDVQRVFGDAVGSFGDLNPGTGHVDFEPGKPGTDKWSAQIHIDPSWAQKACFTKDEYRELFFTLFHEAMHSSDNMWTRFWTSNDDSNQHHQSIYWREAYEGSRGDGVRRPTPGNMWGTPGATPVDVDALYKDYRKRTPACDC
jgi:RHS repeat-associated protein